MNGLRGRGDSGGGGKGCGSLEEEQDSTSAWGKQPGVPVSSPCPLSSPLSSSLHGKTKLGDSRAVSSVFEVLGFYHQVPFYKVSVHMAEQRMGYGNEVLTLQGLRITNPESNKCL